MNIEEVYGLIAQRLLQGFMTHEELANYYDFLALKGFKKCHEYHCQAEYLLYRDFTTYYINHYNKLISKYSFENLSTPFIIPQNWYSNKRQDVDIVVKRNGIKNGFEKWLHWEKQTKKFFQDMYSELTKANEFAAAFKVKKYIQDVDKEIEDAQLKYLQLKAMDFDMPTIVACQQDIYKKYQKKLRKDFCHD